MTTNIELTDTFFGFNEDGEMVNLKFYTDADTRSMSMWYYNPETESSERIHKLPSSVEEGVEWFEGKFHINLHRATDDPQVPDENTMGYVPLVKIEDEPEINLSELEAANMDKASALLDAANLVSIINSCLEDSYWASDLSLSETEEGNILVAHGQAVAVIAIGVKRS